MRGRSIGQDEKTPNKRVETLKGEKERYRGEGGGDECRWKAHNRADQ